MALEIERVHDAFLHAEMVGQARLNNFLMTGTILLIGSAVSLAILEMKFVGPAMSLVLATLGVYFSKAWYYLGRRQRMYHHFAEYILNETASASYGVARGIRRLRYFHSKVITKPLKDQQADVFEERGSHPEMKYSSRKLLTTVPRYFAIAYVAVWIISYAVLAWQLKSIGTEEHGVKLFNSALYFFALLSLIVLWTYGEEIRTMSKEVTSEELDEHIRTALKGVGSG